MSKPRGSAAVPGQEVVPQVERYTGSDVLGMEYTTARPMGWETGANPPLPMPGDRCPGDLCHYATVKGKKVMR